MNKISSQSCPGVKWEKNYVKHVDSAERHSKLWWRQVPLAGLSVFANSPRGWGPDPCSDTRIVYRWPPFPKSEDVTKWLVSLTLGKSQPLAFGFLKGNVMLYGRFGNQIRQCRDKHSSWSFLKIRWKWAETSETKWGSNSRAASECSVAFRILTFMAFHVSVPIYISIYIGFILKTPYSNNLGIVRDGYSYDPIRII